MNASDAFALEVFLLKSVASDECSNLAQLLPDYFSVSGGVILSKLSSWSR